MSNQKTDSSGQQVQPRMLTHFGDGNVPLTNRDVSADLARIDISVSALRDAITQASPNNKTLKDLFDQIAALRGSAGSAEGVTAIAAGAWGSISFQPSAGQIKRVTRVQSRFSTGSASSRTILNLESPTLHDSAPYIADSTGDPSDVSWDGDMDLSNEYYMKLRAYNGAGTQQNINWIFMAITR